MKPGKTIVYSIDFFNVYVNQRIVISPNYLEAIRRRGNKNLGAENNG
jgi:hypothetical protein